ncbi:S-adenosylmethionine decarboxylase proenzyme [Planctomycetales bacterium 10988]|nr:S-adenosylmethionine decarboxylase proenzyme [Planctomycetales bacterium 10988]
MAKPVGTHCILELYGCSSAKLNNAVLLRQILTQAAIECRSTLLEFIQHEFTPQGVTAVALLAESHLSIHTWPEEQYAAVDVFTCGEKTEPKLACDYLALQLGAKQKVLRIFPRGGSYEQQVALPRPVIQEAPLCPTLS